MTKISFKNVAYKPRVTNDVIVRMSPHREWFVTGHDFSRAVTGREERVLTPEAYKIPDPVLYKIDFNDLEYS